jgi:hypothetical protein
MSDPKQNPICKDCGGPLQQVVCHYDYSETTILENGKVVCYEAPSIGDFTDMSCIGGRGDHAANRGDPPAALRIL